jgi:hypothetical protein
LGFLAAQTTTIDLTLLPCPEIPTPSASSAASAMN